MTDPMMDLQALLEKAGDVDFVRETLGFAVQRLMEIEVERRTGAAWGEKSPERLVSRNGYRPRPWDTGVGRVELMIPKLRRGSYFPSFLHPRRTAERALVAVVQEAWIHGISTRAADDLLKACGLTGISKSQVSRLCAEIDERVQAFLNRPLVADYPYLWIDATYLKVRENGRVVSKAVILAVGVDGDGRREVLGMDVGTSEAEPFWREFLRKLVRRGLKEVQLVISDAHEGIKAAVERVLVTSWQRCRVHFMRTVQAHVGPRAKRMVSAFIATAFAQDTPEAARAQWRRIADQLRPTLPKVAMLMDAAETEVLTYMVFPAQHRTKLHSTNPLERPIREIKRRTDVVGIFPNEAAVFRLVGALLFELHDEWAVQKRRSMTLESLSPFGDDPAASLDRLTAPALAGTAR